MKIKNIIRKYLKTVLFNCKNDKSQSKHIIAKDKEHLKKLIEKEIYILGNECDLNYINTFKITDMSYLFEKSFFNGNISNWNTSNVTNMTGIFKSSQFNGDISKWDVSNVNDMNMMFFLSQFNGDISNWDVSKVKYMNMIFCLSQYNKDISHWNIENVTDVELIFYKSEVEKPWWAIEDNDKRKVAIDNYHLMQKLNDKLHNKVIKKPKKIKI